LLLIDVDRFKQINDKHSHVLGDEVLCRVGDVLAGAVREGDLVARLGGDEFVLLLRNQGGRTAEGCVRQIEDAMRQHDWSQLAPNLSVSLSIGLARIAQGDTAEQLIARADAAMYAHKARHGAHAGRIYEEARAGV
jgi:diguanylate cyclase (GGDEF)-like protein